MPEFRITDLLKGKKEAEIKNSPAQKGSFRISDLHKKSKNNISQDDQEKPANLNTSEGEQVKTTFRITDMMPELNNEPRTHAKAPSHPSSSVQPKTTKPFIKPRSSGPQPPSHEESDHHKNQATHSRSRSPKRRELSLRENWNIVMRYRWVILCVTLIPPMLRVLPLINEQRPYYSSAKIIYEKQTSQFDARSGISPIVLYSDTVLRLAFTPSILTETFRLFRSNDISPIAENKKILKEEVDAISSKGLSQFLQLKTLGEEKDIIVITAQSRSHPQTSVFMVNSFCQALLEGLQSFITTEYETQLQQIDENIKLNKMDLQRAENELYLLLDPEEGLKLSSSNDKIIQKIEELKKRKTRNELRSEELDGSVSSLRKKVGLKGSSQIKDIRWIDQKSKRYQQWQSLEVQKQELKSTHHPESPQVKKNDLKIKKIKESLFPESSKLIIQLEATNSNLNQIRQLKIDLESKQNSKNLINALKQQIFKLSEQIVATSEEQNLINKIASHMEYLEIFRQKLHESKRQVSMIKLSAQTGYSVMQWGDHAVQHEATNWLFSVFQGLVGGLFLSIGLIFILYKFENTPKHSIDLARKFTVRVLGVTPKWNAKDKYLAHHDLIDSAMGEMYSIIKNNIRFSHNHHDKVVVFITSPLQNDGKSLTAVNLAISYALEKESVVLLSTDLRTPNSLTSLTSSINNKNGVSEYLKNENLTIEDCIHASEFECLDVIPTFGSINNPSRYLTGERFSGLIKSLKERYSIILVDTPAVLPIVDTCSFVHLADVVLMVAQAEKTTFKDINICLSRFAHVGVTPNGIILNGVQNMSLESFYGSELKTV